MRWQKKYIYCSTRLIYPVLYNAGIQYALDEWPTTPRKRLHSCIFATTSEESCETDPTGHKRLHILKDTTVCIFYYRRKANLFGTSGCCYCCCCCCFPHSACCLPTRKLLYTVANAACRLLKRENRRKRESLAAHPVTPTLLAGGEKQINTTQGAHSKPNKNKKCSEGKGST